MDLDVATVAITIATSVPPAGTPTKIIAAATTTSRNDALITAIKEQNAAQTAQINHMLIALSAIGGGRQRNDDPA